MDHIARTTELDVKKMRGQYLSNLTAAIF